MPEIASEEIIDWLRLPVTKEFFSKLRQMERDYDSQVHGNLAKQEHQMAADYNAGLHAIKEILAGPQQMIDDLNDLKKKGKNEST